MAKIVFTSITGSFASVAQLNASFQQIADELNDKVLYRVNPVGEPNTISNDIDFNSNNLLNGNAGAFVSLTINGVQVTSPDIVTAPTASQVANVPAGDVAAITVQAAIDELDTEKAPLASPALTGNPTAPTPSAGDSDTSIATTAFVNTGFVDQDSETGAANNPAGTTAQRPANGAGKFRFNSTLGEFEGNDGTAWASLAAESAASETVAGIAEIATQAETDAGTDDTRFLTALKFKNAALGQSLAGNGFATLPGGLIIQWGTNNVAGLSTSAVTLPTAFPTAGLMSVCSYDSNATTIDNPCASLTPTTTTITLANGQAGALDIAWIAIGH